MCPERGQLRGCVGGALSNAWLFSGGGVYGWESRSELVSQHWDLGGGFTCNGVLCLLWHRAAVTFCGTYVPVWVLFCSCAERLRLGGMHVGGTMRCEGREVNKAWLMLPLVCKTLHCLHPTRRLVTHSHSLFVCLARVWSVNALAAVVLCGPAELVHKRRSGSDSTCLSGGCASCEDAHGCCTRG